jgi:hypothetical protein
VTFIKKGIKKTKIKISKIEQRTRAVDRAMPLPLARRPFCVSPNRLRAPTMRLSLIESVHKKPKQQQQQQQTKHAMKNHTFENKIQKSATSTLRKNQMNSDLKFLRLCGQFFLQCQLFFGPETARFVEFVLSGLQISHLDVK